MKYRIRKDNCPFCEPHMRGWLVTDERGNLAYFSWNWDEAVHYVTGSPNKSGKRVGA